MKIRHIRKIKPEVEKLLSDLIAGWLKEDSSYLIGPDRQAVYGDGDGFEYLIRTGWGKINVIVYEREKGIDKGARKLNYREVIEHWTGDKLIPVEDKPAITKHAWKIIEEGNNAETTKEEK